MSAADVFRPAGSRVVPRKDISSLAVLNKAAGDFFVRTGTKRGSPHLEVCQQELTGARCAGRNKISPAGF